MDTFFLAEQVIRDFFCLDKFINSPQRIQNKQRTKAEAPNQTNYSKASLLYLSSYQAAYRHCAVEHLK